MYFTIHNCIPGGIIMKYGGDTKFPSLREESLYQLPTTSPTWPELGHNIDRCIRTLYVTSKLCLVYLKASGLISGATFIYSSYLYSHQYRLHSALCRPWVNGLLCSLSDIWPLTGIVHSGMPYHTMPWCIWAIRSACKSSTSTILKVL